jgi:dihydroneopterin aldolase
MKVSIILKDLKLHNNIGIFPSETSKQNNIFINIKLNYILRKPIVFENIYPEICYIEILKLIKNSLNNLKFYFLEFLIFYFINILFKFNKNIIEISIKIKKSSNISYIKYSAIKVNVSRKEFYNDF